MSIKITKDMISPKFQSKFISIYDLQYAEGKHYLDATRRSEDDLVAVKSTEEFKSMLPDAVTTVVILTGGEDRILLSKEYRYPTGRFLLSPPAGLIDPEDKNEKDPLITTAIREIWEETGIKVSDKDNLFVINPCLFSTPGMTDESNALVCAVLSDVDESVLNQDGAEGSELFDGFVLLNKEDAKKALREGRDNDGIFYSVYTWAALMYFVSDMWK